MAESLEFSNNILNTKTIEGLIGLFEGDGISDFWLANVATSSLSDTAKDNIRKNFPRANYLREIILKLCWSISAPKICPSDELDEGRAAELRKAIEEMAGRRQWEGAKDFYAALPWWRAFNFVTGDVFVKLPVVDGKVYPERLPAQNTKILMDERIRKIIKGYQFTYMVGNDMFTDGGDETEQIRETILPDSWIIEREGQANEELPIIKDVMPVCHMAWEEREDSPRGLPLALRLADKALHVYSVQLDRRLGNKMGSGPMFVSENNSGTLPNMGPGAVIAIKTEVPFAPAKFSALQTSYDDSSSRSEYVDALRELHQAAFLPFELDQQSGTIGDKSGKALQMLNKDQVKYRESYQAVEGAFLQELFYKCLRLEGNDIKMEDLKVEYESNTSEDSTERRADAQFYLDAGLKAKAFEIMGAEEKDAEVMASELDDRLAAQMLSDRPAPDGGGNG